MAKNPWIDFLSSYRKKHPKMSMKQAMKSAASEYKKKGRKKSQKEVTFGPDVKVVQKADQKVGGAIYEEPTKSEPRAGMSVVSKMPKLKGGRPEPRMPKLKGELSI